MDWPDIQRWLREVEGTLKGVTEGSWWAEGGVIHTPNDSGGAVHLARVERDSDAEYIALMNPWVGRALTQVVGVLIELESSAFPAQASLIRAALAELEARCD